jgi:thiamine monophosphate synthase
VAEKATSTAGWLAPVTEALDAIGYEWLADNHPDLAEAIERAVAAGATARQVRSHVMDRTARLESALRCEQSARFLAKGEG